MHANGAWSSLRQKDVDSVKQLFNRTLCPMDHGFASDRAPWGISRLQSIDLSGVGIVFDEGYGARSVSRTRRDILADSLADFLVAIPLQCPSRIAQFGTVRSCEPGYFRILSTAAPFTGYVAASNSYDRYSELLARIPGAMLRDLVPRIDEMSNCSLPLRRGGRYLLKSLFTLALDAGDELNEAQSGELSTSIVRMLAAVVTESSEYRCLRGSPRIAAPARVRERAREYVVRNLANPALDCSLVAEHCQVSTRYLRLVFSGLDTVAEFIRESRLQRCRSALQDPALSQHTVEQIASKWGFVSSASFNRIYKARFGVTPGGDRGSGRIEKTC
jgi:AraC-like DNA-binding protein